MSGENSVFGAGGYGNAVFNVTHIAYGTTMVYDLAESRAQRTVYFRNLHYDNFEVALVFDSWDAYKAGADWFRGYMDLAADPGRTGLSGMAVLVPVRNFAGLGIPVSGVSYGDHVGAITYTMTIEFQGTQDAIAPTIDQVNPPGDTAATAQWHFYPTSDQESSQYFAVDEQLYNSPPSLPTDAINQKPPRSHL